MSAHDPICIVLADSLDPAQPPERIRIFKAGENVTSKGTFVFDADAARAVMDAYVAHGVDLSFDFDHAMVGGASPHDRIAAGWFRLELDEAGDLWAVDIRWTPRALSGIRDREWRYTSPAFMADKTRRIRRVLNVALTNLPATVGIEPIAASTTEQTDMATTETPETGTLVQLTGADSEDAARAIVLGWKDRAAQADALETRVVALEAERDRALVDALVTEALSDGRIVPAQREKLVELAAKAGLDAVRATLDLLPAKPRQHVTPPVSGDVTTLSDEERELAAKFGFSDAAMIAARKVG